MRDQTKAPGLASDPGLSSTLQPNNNTRAPLKWKRVLAALISGKSFNRFEAERELHDHCLHSTVSGLQRNGLVINRRYETVPGYMGCSTEVCRYWLASESLENARELLAGTRPSPAPIGANLGLFDTLAGGA